MTDARCSNNKDYYNILLNNQNQPFKTAQEKCENDKQLKTTSCGDVHESVGTGQKQRGYLVIVPEDIYNSNGQCVNEIEKEICYTYIQNLNKNKCREYTYQLRDTYGNDIDPLILNNEEITEKCEQICSKNDKCKHYFIQDRKCYTSNNCENKIQKIDNQKENVKPITEGGILGQIRSNNQVYQDKTHDQQCIEADGTIENTCKIAGQIQNEIYKDQTAKEQCEANTHNWNAGRRTCSNGVQYQDDIENKPEKVLNKNV